MREPLFWRGSAGDRASAFLPDASTRAKGTQPRGVSRRCVPLVFSVIRSMQLWLLRLVGG